MVRFIAVAVWVLASPAWAQARGTITLRGSLVPAASVRFDGAAGAGLDFVLHRGGEVRLILRATPPYALSASAAAGRSASPPPNGRIVPIRWPVSPRSPRRSSLGPAAVTYTISTP